MKILQKYFKGKIGIYRKKTVIYPANDPNLNLKYSQTQGPFVNFGISISIYIYYLPYTMFLKK